MYTMKLTHYLQLTLACLVAGAGAAAPLVVNPMTTTSWLLCLAAVAAGVGKALSVQSEVAGDKAVKA